MSNPFLNIFKGLKDEIDEKKYKNAYKFFQKRAKDCSIQTYDTLIEMKETKKFFKKEISQRRNKHY